MASNTPIPLISNSIIEWRNKYPEAANDLIETVNKLYSLDLEIVSPGTINCDKILFQNPDKLTLALPFLVKANYGIPTGSYTRSTFATSTVTTSQLAERVAALISDLQSIGILKT